MEEITAKAKKAIQNLRNKAFRQKLWLWIIILLLFVADVTVIVFMIRNKGKLYNK